MFLNLPAAMGYLASIPAAVADFVVTLLVAMTGIGFGWWLRGASRRRMGLYEELGTENQVNRAQEVLGRLHELATRVAADVGEHNTRVEEINEELIANENRETEVVVTAVARLLQANSRMQRQLASAEEKIQEQARLVECHAAEARTDPLTRLPNRRALDDELAHFHAEFQRSGTPVSLLMLDVDHFKKFNDIYGHPAGDEVLRSLADVLRTNMRPTDLTARYGGEEFVIILPRTTAADARLSAERLREAIQRKQFEIGKDGPDHRTLQVTVSIGGAQLAPGESGAALTQRADDALYASKNAGRNCTHWHEGSSIVPVVGKKQTATDTSTVSMRAPSKTTPAEPKAAPAPPPTGARTPDPADVPRDLQPWPNRSAFASTLTGRLAEWRRGGSAPSVILIQIDNLAEIFSRHGQQVSNLVLKTTGQFLLAAVREMDLVGRFEDSETFALLLPGAGLVNAAAVAERLRQAALRCALPVQGAQLRYTISLGGAEATTSDDSDHLVKRAEQALLCAVKSGGNCSYYHNGQWSETVYATLQQAKTPGR